MKRRGFLKAFLATTILIGAFRDLAPAVPKYKLEGIDYEFVWFDEPPATHILVHPKVMKLLEAMG